MQLARIIGTATATVKHPSLAGATLLVVQPLMADRRSPDGDPQLASTRWRRRVGDVVVITSDGRLLREILTQRRHAGPLEHDRPGGHSMSSSPHARRRRDPGRSSPR